MDRLEALAGVTVVAVLQRAVNDTLRLVGAAIFGGWWRLCLLCSYFEDSGSEKVGNTVPLHIVAAPHFHGGCSGL